MSLQFLEQSLVTSYITTRLAKFASKLQAELLEPLPVGLEDPSSVDPVGGARRDLQCSRARAGPGRCQVPKAAGKSGDACGSCHAAQHKCATQRRRC